MCPTEEEKIYVPSPKKKYMYKIKSILAALHIVYFVHFLANKAGTTKEKQNKSMIILKLIRTS